MTKNQEAPFTLSGYGRGHWQGLLLSIISYLSGMSVSIMSKLYFQGSVNNSWFLGNLDMVENPTQQQHNTTTTTVGVDMKITLH